MGKDELVEVGVGGGGVGGGLGLELVLEGVEGDGGDFGGVDAFGAPCGGSGACGHDGDVKLDGSWKNRPRPLAKVFLWTLAREERLVVEGDTPGTKRNGQSTVVLRYSGH